MELKWVLNDDDDDSQEQLDLLAIYYKQVANGPMKEYRGIIQSGNKQGQNYYTHVLDGIHVLHKLRVADIVEINELEEELLFSAYTIHDINKIPRYGGRNVKSSYIDIASLNNIRSELEYIGIERFFPEWEQYLEDIRLLMLLHQHDGKPLTDLDLTNHQYALRYRRLLELGALMYAVDNLDLSHTLSEKSFKDGFLQTVNAVAERRWRWVTHHLGENRAVFSNLMHNVVVEYLQHRHAHNGRPVIADLLYYPDGVAYLLPEREAFTWDEIDNSNVAQRLAKLIMRKQADSLHQFIKASPLGIRVSNAAIDSGANFTQMMYVIRKTVDRKSYSAIWHEGYNQKLREDIVAATSHSDSSISVLATEFLNQTGPLVPQDQELLRRGEMAWGYYNLLHDHLEKALKQVDPPHDAWTHVYNLLNLPKEKYNFYNQVNHYRRTYVIACDCQDKLDLIFERFLTDLAVIVGEETESSGDSDFFREYLATNLEFQGAGYRPDFTAYLQHYCKDKHKQCCMCSSSSFTTKLMAPEVPANIGVQVFSNRLRGGSGEPKRNVCPMCRTQLILEKLTRASFKKGSDQYTNFYLHLYPYAFFTRSYQDAIYFTLKDIVHEDSQCFFLKRDKYFKAWNSQFERSLGTQLVKQAQRHQESNDLPFEPAATKVNGVSVPRFSEATSNTPTLPLNAPGENYAQQFIFALTHALMIADFFGCRVAMSRTPFPLLSHEYMVEHGLAFFVDGVPLNLRWLLPTNEYRSIETYRERNTKDGGVAYLARRKQWANELLDKQGYAAYENISRRLSSLYQLAQQLNLSPEDSEGFLFEVTVALGDDPLSVYHVVDLTIEKQLKERRTGRPSSQNKTSTTKAKKTTKANTVQNIAPEQMAIYITKRVAPLLAELVKE